MDGVVARDGRAGLYEALERRNRLIGRLRIAVPAIGVLVFVALLAQIYVANLNFSVSVSGVSFDRGVLTIQSPRFSGALADGRVYRATAREARTRLGSASVSDLTDLTFELDGRDGYSARATAGSALLHLSSQVLDVSGTMIVTDNTGMTARLLDPVIDWPAQSIQTVEPVDLQFADGTRLLAKSMQYDGVAQRWRFTGVSLQLPGTKGTR